MALLGVTILVAPELGVHARLSAESTRAAPKASVAVVASAIVLAMILPGREHGWWCLEVGLIKPLARVWIAITPIVAGVIWWPNH